MTDIPRFPEMRRLLMSHMGDASRPALGGPDGDPSRTSRLGASRAIAIASVCAAMMERQAERVERIIGGEAL